MSYDPVPILYGEITDNLKRIERIREGIVKREATIRDLEKNNESLRESIAKLEATPCREH